VYDLSVIFVSLFRVNLYGLFNGTMLALEKRINLLFCLCMSNAPLSTSLLLIFRNFPKHRKIE
jgi:hypothetical protein